GKECYPKDSNGDEYYIWNVWTHVRATHNGEAYYAKIIWVKKCTRDVSLLPETRLDKIMSTPSYPKDSLGNESYLKNTEGDEYHLTQRKQVFAIMRVDHFMPKTKIKMNFIP
ncbi:hypothetical protein TNCV_3543481, partial [Trichonephila clavipes]